MNSALLGCYAAGSGCVKAQKSALSVTTYSVFVYGAVTVTTTSTATTTTTTTNTTVKNNFKTNIKTTNVCNK
jgi:hypothetical protein